ncbi:hypothetical protein JHK87_034349 [Glycine soja]|nr:hypothetical protein JHK87_034349 [Glycine soja]
MEGLRKMMRYGVVCSRHPRRLYATKMDLRKPRPMILKRIEKRAQTYPVRGMVPVANEVLQARNDLIHGGHLIQTCWGYKHCAKNWVHEWVKGGLNDILVPVESFHLDKMFQSVIRHDERFDFDHIPAVVELCWQARDDLHEENLNSSSWNLEVANGSVPGAESLSPNNLTSIANKTLTAWETLRSGVEKLLLVYPVKVCKYCSEVHAGPSGHKARFCGVFKYESWKSAHFWMKANVDNLVPPKIVWRRRPQDPPVLLNEGRGFYGGVPAVLDQCSKAGAVVPAKYNCMMKVQGLSGQVNNNFFGITRESNS